MWPQCSSTPPTEPGDTVPPRPPWRPILRTNQRTNRSTDQHPAPFAPAFPEHLLWYHRARAHGDTALFDK